MAGIIDKSPPSYTDGLKWWVDQHTSLFQFLREESGLYGLPDFSAATHCPLTVVQLADLYLQGYPYVVFRASREIVHDSSDMSYTLYHDFRVLDTECFACDVSAESVASAPDRRVALYHRISEAVTALGVKGSIAVAVEPSNEAPWEWRAGMRSRLTHYDAVKAM